MSDGIDPLMGYCGLYCGDCISYKGKIADLAKGLRKELRAGHFDHIAMKGCSRIFKDLDHYNEFYSALGLIMKMRCNQVCRQGKGHQCIPGICCIEKGYKGCWECGEFDDCAKLQFLEPIHNDAHLKNMRLIHEMGIDGFINSRHYW